MKRPMFLKSIKIYKRPMNQPITEYRLDSPSLLLLLVSEPEEEKTEIHSTQLKQASGEERKEEEVNEMPKGDDAVRKKKNKVLRKRLNSNPATVPARIAAIIAAKQRRKNGKRRMCEGMCFSLPTLEDPYNDRYINKGSKANKKKKKDDQSKADAEGSIPQEVKAVEKEKNGKGVLDSTQQGMDSENLNSPSKFLIMCLNAIQNAFLQDGTFDEEEDKSLLVNTWGIQFCKSCLAGLDILETTVGCSTLEQTAWIISTAADIFGRKEREGVSSDNAFLLYLVPSQEKALKVRSVCKSLKALGIHTVSVHSGATVDHQMKGLKDSEPEFIVSTPERLLELVSLKAIDISGVSFLVVDGFETFAKDCSLDKIKSIRQSISGNSQTVILSNCFDNASASTVQNLLKRPICRMSLTDSIASESACISQRVHMCSSEEEKLSKVIQILNESFVKQSSFRHPKVLLIAGSISKAQLLAATLVSEGYTISNIGFSDSSQVASRKKKKLISVADLENIMAMDIGNFEVIMIVDFPPSIDDYVRILTGMARDTVNGVLHSFFFLPKDASLTRPLTEVLEQCWQTVPKALRT